MKVITSRENTQFKSLKKLASSARERRKTGMALLDGIHLVEVYLARVGLPQLAVVAENRLGDREIAQLLATIPDEKLLALDERLFAEISTVESSTGIAALVTIPRHPVRERGRFMLLLEGIQDPGNLGSMLRSAASAGCDQVYCSADCADPWSPKVLRAGMGAHFFLAIEEHDNLPTLAGELGCKVIAAAPQGKESLYEVDMQGALAFAVGNEGNGLSTAMLEVATHVVRIPMPGGMESLNAAAATAICLFEKLRRDQ